MGSATLRSRRVRRTHPGRLTRWGRGCGRARRPVKGRAGFAGSSPAPVGAFTIRVCRGGAGSWRYGVMRSTPYPWPSWSGGSLSRASRRPGPTATGCPRKGTAGSSMNCSCRSWAASRRSPLAPAPAASSCRSDGGGPPRCRSGGDQFVGGGSCWPRRRCSVVSSSSRGRRAVSSPPGGWRAPSQWCAARFQGRGRRRGGSWPDKRPERRSPLSEELQSATVSPPLWRMKI